MKKMSEKGKLVRLIALWAVCLLAGFGVGWLVAGVMKQDAWQPDAYFEAAAPALSLALVTVYALLSVGVLAWAWWQTRRCGQLASTLTQDDEAQLDALEERLGQPMIAVSILMVVVMALYPIILYLVLKDSVDKSLADVLFAIDCAVFFLTLFGGFAINKRCVDIEKQLNPEKRGSLLDLSFQKTWVDSCDEAQKQQIWQAGYQAFRAGSAACMVLWMLSIVLMFLLDTGVMPIVAVCAVWLVLQVSYFSAASRLEHAKR